MVRAMGDDKVEGKVLSIKGHVWVTVETKGVDTIITTEAGHLPPVSSHCLSLSHNK